MTASENKNLDFASGGGCVLKVENVYEASCIPHSSWSACES